MIRGVHHVAISTPNLNRLRDFYCDLLGFSALTEDSWPRGTGVINKVLGLPETSGRQAMLKHTNLCLELFEFSEPVPEPMNPTRPVCNHGHTHICLDVVNIDSVYQRLLENGVEFHAPPQDFGSCKATYGRDPDGNVFEIQELMNAEDPSQTC